jgi:hypothetical protein
LVIRPRSNRKGKSEKDKKNGNGSQGHTTSWRFPEHASQFLGSRIGPLLGLLLNELQQSMKRGRLVFEDAVVSLFPQCQFTRIIID